MNNTLLEVDQLSRAFGNLKAVDRLTFTMKRGEVYGFIGPNGAGKTTTMRILATLDLPDQGTAVVDGIDILANPYRVREKLGFMSDQFRAYNNLEVGEFLDFFALAYGLRGRKRVDRVRMVSSFCDLDGLMHRPANKLSKGMSQRLHLAKTLLHDPQLLILDEPAAGLDPRARVELRDLLRELGAAGKGVLISSHILTELGTICDSVIIIEQGKRVTAGTMAEVSEEAGHLSRVKVKAIGDLAATEQFFLLQPGVEELDLGDQGVNFAFSGDEEDLADLLGRAVKHGLRITEFKKSKADLEEIFMARTEGKLQ